MKFRMLLSPFLLFSILANAAQALDDENTTVWIDTLVELEAWAEDHDPWIHGEIRSLVEPRDLDLNQVWSDYMMENPGVGEMILRHGFAPEANVEVLVPHRERLSSVIE